MSAISNPFSNPFEKGINLSYRTLLVNPPLRLKIHKFLGETFSTNKQLTFAKAHFNQVVKEALYIEKNQLLTATSFFYLGKYYQSYQILQIVLNKNPQCTEACSLKKRIKDSLDYRKKALDIRKMIEELSKQNDKERALRELQNILSSTEKREILKTDPPLLLEIKKLTNRIYVLKGHKTHARKHFIEAVKIVHFIETHILTIASCFLNLGNFANARYYLKIVLEKDPQSTRAKNLENRLNQSMPYLLQAQIIMKKITEFENKKIP